MNDPRKLFVDKRLTGYCVYCGAEPTTRDHCPSKVLLDEPFPADLPVVPACAECNRSFSLDEQYLACFIECVICGTADPPGVKRANVSRILRAVPLLASRIRAALSTNEDGQKTWQPNMDRVRNVVVKLARGHLDYELGVQELVDPDEIHVMPLALMSHEHREFFECPESDVITTWPELGSRAFMCAIPSGERIIDNWIDVQGGRYRYLVGQSDGNFVHIVLSEYLACRIVWF
ncbi:hypothetical protein SAMN05216588_107194 [Pseudomonas flavescens]|uniref:HNH endonuclease n=1 Tax=Phytopseudomonas flavescens TaxID=29435 RepID=A0A1G8FA15_9GAMM|nr:hypothetical protein [Pseudomonas flavescens]SDH78925.1 hypothetical protein SAMN05216588_107194 [Pseudomonas flavescens]